MIITVDWTPAHLRKPDTPRPVRVWGRMRVLGIPLRRGYLGVSQWDCWRGKFDCETESWSLRRTVTHWAELDGYAPGEEVSPPHLGPYVGWPRCPPLH